MIETEISPVVDASPKNKLSLPVKRFDVYELVRQAKRVIKIALARVGIFDGFRKPLDYVEFETTAYCNRKCSYCPVSMYERPGDKDGVYMSEETFEKLLSDLVKMNFKGKLAPHLYGEPLSDPRMTKWIQRIKEVLPDVSIRLVTNGDYLDGQRYRELIDAGVTYFDLSKHSAEFARPLRDLLGAISEEEKGKHFRIRDFYTDFKNKQDMLNTRGGEVKLKVRKEHPVLCGYVTYPVINTFGDVVLCCNDYHNDHKFGNINEKSLQEIWQDPENLRIRRRIYQSYFDLPICQNCYM